MSPSAQDSTKGSAGAAKKVVAISPVDGFSSDEDEGGGAAAEAEAKQQAPTGGGAAAKKRRFVEWGFWANETAGVSE